MHLSRLAFVVGLFCCCTILADAADKAPPETDSPCDPETDASCVVETDESEGQDGEDGEELDRGFDPCLINASLPACKPATDEEESADAKGAQAEPQEGSARADEDGDSSRP
jgi:hypothetical protein